MRWNCKRVFAYLGEVWNTSQLVNVKLERFYTYFGFYVLFVIADWLNWFFLAEIIGRFWSHKGWSLRNFFIIVNPFDRCLSFLRWTVAELLDRSHLRVQESISEQKFITGKSWLFVAEFIPLAGDLWALGLGKPDFVRWQLMDEGCSDFEIRSSWVQKFKCFK